MEPLRAKPSDGIKPSTNVRRLGRGSAAAADCLEQALRGQVSRKGRSVGSAGSPGCRAALGAPPRPRRAGGSAGRRGLPSPRCAARNALPPWPAARRDLRHRSPTARHRRRRHLRRRHGRGSKVTLRRAGPTPLVSRATAGRCFRLCILEAAPRARPAHRAGLAPLPAARGAEPRRVWPCAAGIGCESVHIAPRGHVLQVYTVVGE